MVAASKSKIILYQDAIEVRGRQGGKTTKADGSSRLPA
jgi:hypothetical protein